MMDHRTKTAKLFSFLLVVSLLLVSIPIHARAKQVDLESTPSRMRYSLKKGESKESSFLLANKGNTSLKGELWFDQAECGLACPSVIFVASGRTMRDIEITANSSEEIFFKIKSDLQNPVDSWVLDCHFVENGSWENEENKTLVFTVILTIEQNYICFLPVIGIAALTVVGVVLLLKHKRESKL